MLTIGMACANDYQGVYFTVQALRLYQDLEPGDEIIVIDNAPDTEEGKLTKGLIENWVPGGRYIPYTAKKSTAVREQIFEQADNDYALCLDCHVLLAPGAITSLKDHFAREPASKDLILGPFVHDDLGLPCTHMDPVWRHAMLGTWSQCWACTCGHRFVVSETGGTLVVYHSMPIGYSMPPPYATCPGCGSELPAIPWAGHQRELLDAGYRLLGASPTDEPFDIPMQGLAAFACRTAAWPGFHPMFQGFGCEEWYIAEKARRAGGRVVCLPSLRWIHRFNRPGGHGTGSTAEDKVWNYVVGHLELGLDPTPAIDHFGKFHPPREKWAALAEHAAKHLDAVTRQTDQVRRAREPIQATVAARDSLLSMNP